MKLSFRIGPAKTDGVQTTGKTFSQIKQELESKAKEGGLSKNSALRWTAEKGLYAKDGIRNTSNNTMFGSGVWLRGKKFLGAREDIARCINFGYDYQVPDHEENKLNKPIGEFVVDEVLTERARNEIRNEPGGADLEEGELRRRVEARAAKLELRIQDLGTLQERLETYMGRGAEAAHHQWSPSVRYMHGRKTEKVMVAETDNLCQAICDDYLRTRSKELGKVAYVLNKEGIQKDAVQLAQTVLRNVGHRTCFIETANNGNRDNQSINVKSRQEKTYINGGMSETNAEKVRETLQSRKIWPSRTAAVIRDARLPETIRASAERLSTVWTELLEQEGKLFDTAEERKLQSQLGAFGAQTFQQECTNLMAQIQNVAQENKRLLGQLEKLSYPDDLTHIDKRRFIYDALVKNAKDMDKAVAALFDLHRDEDGKRRVTPSDAVWKTYGIAEDFCLETLDLAKAFCSPVQTAKYKTQQPPPLLVSLSEMPKRRGESNFGSRINKGLQQTMATPHILFQADSTGQSGFESVINDHNERTLKIKDDWAKYEGLVKKGPKERDKHERRQVFEFRKQVKQAIEDNDYLARTIKRRQKILGEVHNTDIDTQLEELREQRIALLLLHYPALMSVPNRHHAQAAMGQLVREKSFGSMQAEYSETGVLVDPSVSNVLEPVDEEDVNAQPSAGHGVTAGGSEDGSEGADVAIGGGLADFGPNYSGRDFRPSVTFDPADAIRDDYLEGPFADFVDNIDVNEADDMDLYIGKPGGKDFRESRAFNLAAFMEQFNEAEAFDKIHEEVDNARSDKESNDVLKLGSKSSVPNVIEEKPDDVAGGNLAVGPEDSVDQLDEYAPPHAAGGVTAGGSDGAFNPLQAALRDAPEESVDQTGLYDADGAENGATSDMSSSGDVIVRTEELDENEVIIKIESARADG